MKRLFFLLISLAIVVAFIGCATHPMKKEAGPAITVEKAKEKAPAAEAPKAAPKAVKLPDFVASQSKKGKPVPESWKKFDKSGKVKFLQVQTTAPGSPAGQGSKLDGSIGERLVEIQVDPSITSKEVVWSLKNSGKSTVWVVAAGNPQGSLPLAIDPGQTVTLKTALDKDNYTFVVVDNEGGKKTTLELKAKCGGVDAKTTRGKSMKVVWF